MHWFIDPIKYHYADFHGRASREEFWMFQLSFILIYAFLGIIVGIGSATLSSMRIHDVSLLLVVTFILSILGIIIPSLALQARRLHDIGQTGWLLLLTFIPYIGSLILLVLFCLPSNPGSNKWGANPHGVGTIPPFTPSTTVPTQSNVPPTMPPTS